MPAAATTVVFREVQRFRQWFLYLPVAIVTVLVWWEFAQQVVLGHPTAERPIPNWLAWVFAIVFGLGLPAFLALIRLVTEVTPECLCVRLYPFPPARISIAQIESASVREYSPITEFGGWGVRQSRSHGRAYTASGNKGVQLQVRGKGPILIGSQRADELLAALRSVGVQ
ncbi:MAG: DUF6141 family protein [Thermoleophilia bacterium]|nr:DUF6141 family protein [Thermoleophilia bacterium]